MTLRFCLALLAIAAAPAPRQVEIVRDEWGIAHVHGRSDADAVYGAIYAQAEDDFPRIEANLLAALGRSAEAEGEAAVWRDLRQRLWIDPVRLRADYAHAPGWLRALMEAWADGLNRYLATHPQVHPRVLTRFEPWMALAFTEGSIGGDIERAELGGLAAFYGGKPTALAIADRPDDEPRGSNGIAIAPKLTRNGHALLLINPHTSFFFRSELEMRSDAGLHAYGAATWGQFFLYQGFNEHLGWMHTSSGMDAVDEFAETIVRDGGGLRYRYGAALRDVETRPIAIRVRQPDGSTADRRFVTYRTHHGPIVRAEGGRWIAMALMDRPIEALEQSWLRTTARDEAGFLRVAALAGNSSNDTIYADAAGHVRYLHPQFVPVRDDRFDYRGMVDGADPATDWRGVTPLADLPQVRDPAGGWLYNSNDAPWRAAGADSPKQAAFPRYMDAVGANPRGDHATALLGAARALTPEGLRAIAYDPWMPAFVRMVPPLVAAWQALPPGDPQRARLAGPVALLRGWDARWSLASKPTTLANYWGEAMWDAAAAPAKAARVSIYDWMAERPTPADRLAALDRAVARMGRHWGGWRVAWGDVNRFQRPPAIAPAFDDARPSVAVPFASARWGSLASFGAKSYPGTRRWYGTSGNSFVAIVEFGPRVRAWGVSAGGEGGDPASPHFTDQVARYAAGDLRPIHFWPDELEGHVARRYRP